MGKEAFSPRRVWRVTAPKEAWENARRGKVRWTPAQLTVREGIRQTAIVDLVGYVLLLLGNAWLVGKVLTSLPQVVALPVHFGMGHMEVHSVVLALAMAGIQIYLIYRELIRKLFTQTLLLVPVMYFVVEAAIVLQLCRAYGAG